MNYISPYSLTLWREYWDENNVYREEKIVELANSESVFEGRAREITFTRNINGTNTLSFKIPRWYTNRDTGNIVSNYLASKVVNKSKIKLLFKNEWFEFVVNEINYSKEKNQIFHEYKCEDIFINELAKTGYSISFDEDNGLGNIDELGEKILLGTDWTLLPSESDNFIERKKTKVWDPALGKFVESVTSVPLPVTKFNNILKKNVNEYEIFTGDSFKRNYSYNGIEYPIYGYTSKEPNTCVNHIGNSYNFTSTAGWTNVAEKNAAGEMAETATLKTLILEAAPNNHLLLQINTIADSALIKNSAMIKPILAYRKYAFKITALGTNNYSYLSAAIGTEEEIPTFFCPIATNTLYCFGSDTEIEKPQLYIRVGGKNKTFTIQKIELFEIIGKELAHNQLLANINYKTAGAAYLGKIMDANEINLFNEYAMTPETVAAMYHRTFIDYFIEVDKEIIYLNGQLKDKTLQEVVLVDNLKVRILKEEKSNRYNLLQSLCELFEGWVKVIVPHETDGRLILNGNKPIKQIQFVDIIGQVNPFGFHNGINLSEVKRDVNSTEIVSKLWVEPIEYEGSPTGLITIQNAVDNTLGENFIYNFDYYIESGELYEPTFKLDYDAMIAILQSSNALIKEYNEKLISLEYLIRDMSNKLYVAVTSVKSATKNKELLEIEKNKPGSDKTNIELLILKYATQITYETQNIETYKSLLGANEDLTPTYAGNSWYYQQRELNKLITSLTTAKNNAIQAFENKYKRFITEGFWQDSNYITDNQYYLDALVVSEQSAYPTVGYTLSVIDIETLSEGFEDFQFTMNEYAFNLGDQTKVIDTTFFGVDATGKPLEEEVIISEIEYALERPFDTKIKIQNYRTQFEDLFNKITTSIQSLKLNEQLYSRAKNFTTGGQINPDVLQNTLRNNSIFVAQSADGSVTINDKGINLASPVNLSKRLRITAEGIFLSSDNGENWQLAVNSDGLNADTIKTGTLNTQSVNIVNGADPAFSWDVLGITAYQTNFKSTTNAGAYARDGFVRFDQHGLYMPMPIKQNIFKLNENDKPWFDDELLTWEDRLNLIERNSTLSITRNGILIRSLPSLEFGDRYFKMSTETNNITFYQDGVDRLTLGQLKNYTQEYNESYYNYTIGEVSYRSTLIEEISSLADIDQAAIAVGDAFRVDTEFTVTNISYIPVESRTPGVVYPYYNLDETITFKVNDLLISLTTKTPPITEFDYELWQINSQIVEFVAEETDNYGLVIKDNESTIVMYTDSEGQLKIKNGIYIGDYGNPYMGLEIVSKNKLGKVIWAGPQYTGLEITDYIFSVDDLGRLTAQNADIAGTITASAGRFIGHIKIGADEMLSGINPAADPVFYINNDVFTIDSNGLVTGKNANFSGNIDVDSGNIKTVLNIGDTLSLRNVPYDEYRILLNNNDEDLFYVKRSGDIYAKNLKIGEGAAVKKYLMVGGNGFINGDSGSDVFLGVAKNAIDIKSKLDAGTMSANNTNFLVTQKGEIHASKLTINGSGNVLSGSLTINYNNNGTIVFDRDNNDIPQIRGVDPNNITQWYINGYGNSEFRDITARGKILTSVFEYGKVQAIGGILFARPSFIIDYIERVNGEVYTHIVHLKEEVSFNQDNFVYIQKQNDLVNENSCYGVITADVEFDKSVYCNFYNNNFDPRGYESSTLIILGKNKEGGIILNSTTQRIAGEPESLTLYQNDFENGVYSRNPKIVLGNLNYLNMNNIGGYGLYAENAFLRGTIATSNLESGITTKDSLSKVVIWGGLEANDIPTDGTPIDYTKSKFYVTKDGVLVAREGSFGGSIYTTDAHISGRVIGDGLIIDGKSQGIKFMIGTEDIENLTASIDGEGLHLYNKADLKIFKNEYNPNTVYLPYIYTGDKSESLFSKNIGVFNKTSMGILTDLLKISPNSIGYISNTEADILDDDLIQSNAAAAINFTSDSINLINEATMSVKDNEVTMYKSKAQTSVIEERIEFGELSDKIIIVPYREASINKGINFFVI